MRKVLPPLWVRRHERRLQWGRNLTVAEGMPYVWRFGTAARLQWGRNLTVAEGFQGGRPVIPRSDASMGPQLDSCGRGAALGGRHGLFVASMGPQLDSCGRSLKAAADELNAGLQWGRNLTVAEGSPQPRAPALPRHWLQWGRNLTVAEGALRKRSARTAAPASMGPQLDSCGRPTTTA